MSNELTYHSETNTGDTIYFQRESTNGLLWNGSEYEVPSSLNWDDYDIPATEAATATGIFRATNPVGSGTTGSIIIRQQVGGSPAVADPVLGTGAFPPTNSELTSGARAISITVNDGVTPVENAIIRITEGLTSQQLATNSSGVAVFSLDDATYTISITKALYVFTPVSLVVTASASQTYSITASTIPASNASLVTGIYYCYDETGTIEADVVVELEVTYLPGKGVALDSKIRTGTSDSNGLVTFTNLFKGATYRMRRGDEATWVSITIPVTALATISLTNIIGAD